MGDTGIRSTIKKTTWQVRELLVLKIKISIALLSILDRYREREINNKVSDFIIQNFNILSIEFEYRCRLSTVIEYYLCRFHRCR